MLCHSHLVTLKGLKRLLSEGRLSHPRSIRVILRLGSDASSASAAVRLRVGDAEVLVRRRRSPSRNVVMLSAHGQGVDRELSRLTGCQEYDVRKDMESRVMQYGLCYLVRQFWLEKISNSPWLSVQAQSHHEQDNEVHRSGGKR
jgi:hypothetical protein